MNKDLVVYEPHIKRIAVIPYEYEITNIPGLAFNGYMRMYYHIPEDRYIPLEEAWSLCPELKFKKESVPEKSYMHPHHKAQLSVFCVLLIVIGLAGFDAVYRILTPGYGLILVILLFYIAAGCMILLFTNPSESELARWERERRMKDGRNGR